MFRALRDCVCLWDVQTIHSPASMSLAISACQQMNKNALNILQWSLDRAIPGRRQNCAIPCEPMQCIKSKTRVTTHESHHYAMNWPNMIQSVQSNGSKGAISSKSNHQPSTKEFRGRAEIAGAKTIHWVIQQENLPAVHLQWMSSLSVFIWPVFLISFSLVRIWSSCMRIRACARPPEQVASTPSRNECATVVRQVRLNRPWTWEQHVMCHAHQCTIYQKTLELCTTCRTVMSFIDWTWTQGLLRGWPRIPLVKQRWRIVQLRQPWQAKYIKGTRPHFSTYSY